MDFQSVMETMAEAWVAANTKNEVQVQCHRLNESISLIVKLQESSLDKNLCGNRYLKYLY